MADSQEVSGRNNRGEDESGGIQGDAIPGEALSLVWVKPSEVRVGQEFEVIMGCNLSLHPNTQTIVYRDTHNSPVKGVRQVQKHENGSFRFEKLFVDCEPPKAKTQITMEFELWVSCESRAKAPATVILLPEPDQ